MYCALLYALKYYSAWAGQHAFYKDMMIPLYPLFYLISSGINRNHSKLGMLMNALEDKVPVQSSDQTAFSIKDGKN